VSLGQVQFKGPQPYLLVSLFFARQDLFNKQQQYSQAAMKHDLLLFSTGLPNKTNLADPCEAYQYILMHYSQAALNQSVLCFSMPSVWCTLYTHLKQRRPFEHIASLAFCVAAIHWSTLQLTAFLVVCRQSTLAGIWTWPGWAQQAVPGSALLVGHMRQAGIWLESTVYSTLVAHWLLLTFFNEPRVLNMNL